MYMKFFMKMLYNYKDLSLIFFKWWRFAKNIQENINNRCMYMFIPNSRQEKYAPHEGIFCLLFELEFNSYDALCICDFPYRQMVKNLPALQETWIWSLGQEDPLEQGNGYPLQHSCLIKPMDREAWRATSMGSQSLARLSN